MAQTTILSEL